MKAPQHDSDMMRKIFDALPVIILLVDEEVRILDYNVAASALVGPEKKTVFRIRGGEALHCLHSQDVPEGCGKGPVCKECVIWTSVRSAFTSKQLSRGRAKLERLESGKKSEMHALITAVPILRVDKDLVLLMIEDISEMMAIEQIIPICAGCKKIRDDTDYWQQVEVFLGSRFDMRLTHGLCPDCRKIQLDAYRNRARPQREDEKSSS